MTKCLICNTDTQNPKFCSRSCAAKHNNHKIPKRKRKNILYCVSCNKELSRFNKKYCNNYCHRDLTWKLKCLEFENSGVWIGANCEYSISKNLKKYILEKRGRCCEICKNTHWMGKEIPLIIDHIDGHSNNNTLENTRLVCGNCDMQLPTYKSKNRGNGRASRRERYKNGQSY